MANVGQTMFRLAGALLLAGAATRYDHPPRHNPPAPVAVAVPRATSTGLQVKITPGKRAYSIRVDDAGDKAALIQPNSRVDVLVILQSPDDPTRRVAKIFMANMRVLAIGEVVQRQADGRPIRGKVATLEVTPQEAEKLAIAARQGTFSLALRGYGNPDSVVTRGTVASDIVRAPR